MSHVICVANQKGGVGKTTTSIMCAYLISQFHKVLCVDMDPQSDFTEALAQEAAVVFDGETLLEAMWKKDARPYIKKVTDNLHFIPSNDHLTGIHETLYTMPKPDRYMVLKETLAPVRNEYDFILVDAAPSPDAKLANCLVASDYVLVMFKPANFCDHALDRFFESVETAQEEANPDLKVIGILPTMVGAQRNDVQAYMHTVKKEYGDLVLQTQIRYLAAHERFTIGGFLNNPETQKSAEPYSEVVMELMDRIGVKVNG
ncbi:ParA family protein [Desmospora activa]|uniref:Chromosome partitioning protein n=1 Tax=Desmospora activa DSM 45169 TaxID=1121389 RepID=A0A2T4YZ13_9BACL|nr:ParA family protein [Desmospora activa]PTM52194.1 chromosome partitioning protein [Desmospora activa DSM 45169]